MELKFGHVGEPGSLFDSLANEFAKRANAKLGDKARVVNLGIGQQTPPVASVLMTCCAIAKADMWEVTKVNVYFVAVLLAGLILVTYVPVTGMGLVDLFYH
jgi:hypothetical protein